jgi:hypothetical protein
MKALKLFRALSMAGGLTCFMMSCLPDIKGENGYDWMMIAVIALVLVVLPTTLIVRIKRENHPESLTEFTKGYQTINIIASAIMIGLCITSVIVKSEMMWMGLAFAFVGLYNLLNSFIFYNARKAYEEEKLNHK